VPFAIANNSSVMPYYKEINEQSLQDNYNLANNTQVNNYNNPTSTFQSSPYKHEFFNVNSNNSVAKFPIVNNVSNSQYYNNNSIKPIESISIVSNNEVIKAVIPTPGQRKNKQQQENNNKAKVINNSVVQSNSLINNSVVQSKSLINNSVVQSNSLINNSVVQSNSLINNSVVQFKVINETHEEILEKLSYTIEDIVGETPFNLEKIELAKELIIKSNFAYDSFIRFCPDLFNFYLKNNGIIKDMEEDLIYIIKDVIENKIAIDWNLFILKLSEYKFEFPQRNHELYLDNVNDIQKLIDVTKFGFVDHRFNHAIILMQRLIRYVKSDPPPVIETERKIWYNAFEEKHNKRDESWKLYNIRVESIKDIKNITMDNGEVSVLRWNRHLIPSYIQSNFINDKDLNFVIDLVPIIGISMEELKNMKTEKILHLIKNNLNYDFYSKLIEVASMYFTGEFDVFRSKNLNGLKYIEIYPEFSDYGYPKYISKHALKFLFPYKLDVIHKVVEKTKSLTSMSGLLLLGDFIDINIAKLTIDHLKDWFMKIAIDTLEEIVLSVKNEKKTKFNKNITETKVRMFLNNEFFEDLLLHYNDIIEFIRSVLINYQEIIKNHKNPFSQVLHYTLPTIKKITI